MRQTAIAFSTTGKNPKEGHRLRELVAVEQVNGQPTGRSLHAIFKLEPAQGGKTFAEQFDSIDALIGDSIVVVHNAGIWRKFLRPELRQIKKRGARRLLKQVLDVNQWAHQHFPRQRKDLAAIARKLQVAVPSDFEGLALDAELLRHIGAAMHTATVSTVTGSEQPASPHPEMSAIPQEVAAPMVHDASRQKVMRTFGERINLCWQVLTGRA